jgi:hypothetical protein
MSTGAPATTSPSSYGQTTESRIVDSADSVRVFSWLICEVDDDKGNALVYTYAAENSADVDPSQVHEYNRNVSIRKANRYLKHICSGNRISRLIQPDLTQMAWKFEVVLDHDEGHYEELAPTRPGSQLSNISLFVPQYHRLVPGAFVWTRSPPTGLDLRCATSAAVAAY